VVDALVGGARAGKEVTVVIELRARFDEEANINLATRLQEAGAHVVYGVVGYKTHAKMMLVARREAAMRRYVHLGTGNYHAHGAPVHRLRAAHLPTGLGEDVERSSCSSPAWAACACEAPAVAVHPARHDS
jgi:polyphosphate kinase